MEVEQDCMQGMEAWKGRRPRLDHPTGEAGMLDYYRLSSRLSSQLLRPILVVSGSSEVPFEDRRGAVLRLVRLHQASIAVALTPLVIYGALSSFQSGQSSVAQRVWTMMWLVLGMCVGSIVQNDIYSLSGRKFVWVWFVPSIGGFVVVGQMILQYGTCVPLSNNRM